MKNVHMMYKDVSFSPQHKDSVSSFRLMKNTTKQNRKTSHLMVQFIRQLIFCVSFVFELAMRQKNNLITNWTFKKQETENFDP